MSNVPDELKYAESHEWARLEEDGSVTVGISDHAQEALGDLVFVETPLVGNRVAAQDACAVVESVKAASDIYAPVTGEIIEANPALTDAPELINSDPYGEGWIMRIRPDEVGELEALLTAEEYQAQISSEED